VLANVTVVKIANVLPDDGVTAPKHVGAVFNVNFNVNFETVFKTFQVCVSW